MIKAIIFDFDGVLLESVDTKTQAFRELFGRVAPERLDAIIQYHIEHMGVSRFIKFRYIYRSILNQPLTAAEEKKLDDRLSALIAREILAVPYVDGALDYLKKYHRRYRLFIASGTPQEELRAIAQQRGIAHYFHEIHGSPRPKKEIILDILDRNRLAPEEAAFVGDADSDMKAAQAAGIPFIARENGKAQAFEHCPIRIKDLRMLDAAIAELNEKDGVRHGKSI